MSGLWEPAPCRQNAIKSERKRALCGRQPYWREWKEDHMSKVQERLDKHDKQIAAIRDLVKEGMRLMIETRKDLRTLAAAQKRTDASLKAFIDTLRRSGGNGHSKTKVDLQ